MAQPSLITTCPWRRFALVRNIDDTGVSGTGTVAEGVIFSDGTAVLRWRPLRQDGETSHAVWPNTTALLNVHGHDGKTTIQMVD